MKKNILAFVILAVCLFASSALALDPMGPPAARMGKGQWGLGVEYSFTNMDVKRVPTSWSPASREVEIDMHKIYANIGYGVSENVTAFVRLGAASMDWDPIKGSNLMWEGDGDWDFIWGGGMSATLCESGDVSWGMLAQFSDGKLGGDESATDGTKGTFENKLTEIQIAFGPTWKASDNVKIYGGPFLHYVRGTWNDKFDGDKHRKPIEEDACLGGYVGAGVALASNMDMTIEYMITDAGWGAAGGLCWKW